MSKTTYLSTLEVFAPNVKAEKVTNQTKEKESNAMNVKYLNTFRQQVPRPNSSNINRIKWIYKNKSYENGVVTRNKARLVAQGYTQIEGIDFDETFALVVCLEDIILLMRISCLVKFKPHQIDIKSAFINGFMNEEFYG